jgi:hypothetical protein
VTGEEDRYTLLAVKALYEGGDLSLPSRVEAQGGFVQKEHFRRVNESPGDPEPLAHTAGVAAYGRPASLRETHRIQQNPCSRARVGITM